MQREKHELFEKECGFFLLGILDLSDVEALAGNKRHR